MGSYSPPEYDYIVCGAGNAGCVVASRLAEDPSVSILVIEAGGPKDSVPASDIPAAVAKIFNTDADWQVKNEPSEQLDGRQLPLPRAKFVGGCSGANGTLCIRGSTKAYDDWKVEGWSGKEMHAYMSKAERFEPKPWFEPEESAHGYDGPIATAPHDNAPISDRVMQSFQSKGFPMVPDMFSTGDVAHGCGHAIRTISKGLRSTAADYLQGSYAKPNVKIETHKYVDSLILDETDGQIRAKGIKMVETVGGRNVELSAMARKEIILSAGAYNSPAILLRSGIGPRAEVEKHGIESVVELDGVGRHLEDHLILSSFYEVNEPDVTNDRHVWHAGGAEKSLKQWKADRSGFMSQFPFGSFAYARLDDRLQDSELWRNAPRAASHLDPMGTSRDTPHVEIWNTEIYFPNYLGRDLPDRGQQTFAMTVELFSPRSPRGCVTLASRDPRANPVVDHNYLTSDLDMLVFSEGCRLASEIALDGTGTKDIVVGPWPPKAKHHQFTTREEWAEEIRQRASTCYHPAGTCKMGAADDNSAVVDSKLRVRGVQALRIADASIMPKLPCGHPQMAVYGIGEKAADLIKKAE